MFVCVRFLSISLKMVYRLDEAIADENYEYAKMYKDEIRRREEEGRSR